MDTIFSKTGLDFLSATRDAHCTSVLDWEEDHFDIENDYLEMPLDSILAVRESNLQRGRYED